MQSLASRRPPRTRRTPISRCGHRDLPRAFRDGDLTTFFAIQVRHRRDTGDQASSWEPTPALTGAVRSRPCARALPSYASTRPSGPVQPACLGANSMCPPEWKLVVARDESTEVRARLSDDGTVSIKLTAGPISVVAAVTDVDVLHLFGRTLRAPEAV
jgi:hypothetical protein